MFTLVLHSVLKLTVIAMLTLEKLEARQKLAKHWKDWDINLNGHSMGNNQVINKFSYIFCSTIWSKSENKLSIEYNHPSVFQNNAWMLYEWVQSALDVDGINCLILFCSRKHGLNIWIINFWSSNDSLKWALVFNCRFKIRTHDD